eukprot:2249013-Pleurochrysis_carterae.AAC.1
MSLLRWNDPECGLNSPRGLYSVCDHAAVVFLCSLRAKRGSLLESRHVSHESGKEKESRSMSVARRSLSTSRRRSLSLLQQLLCRCRSA